MRAGRQLRMSQWIKNWFSNMVPFDKPLIYQGISYATPENFYQAMKTLNEDERRVIAGLDPHAAKRYARKIQIRPGWEVIKTEIMLDVLRYKFAKGTSWHKQLTEHQKPIVELNNWHDNFWGSCVCPKCGNKGLNHLGKIIESLR